MKLSVLIVNHNTCALLKQALNSLINACNGIDYELVIVDNASADKSLDMLTKHFPDIHVIANDTDQGIAKANNQAIRLTNGEYVLLITPDTLCGTDTITKMTGFMDHHPDAGGLSVRTLTPQGRFLPGSIHGLDKPWTAFFKLIGFSKYLSKTRLYDRNRKEWVEEFQTAEVDILNGNCMLLRRRVLDETGLFDDRFFRYGHNIDLSYRIRLAGFKNYYFPKTYVINSESIGMPKLSWSYIKYFYGAMLLFAFKYLLKLPQIKVEPIPQLLPSAYDVK